MTLEPEAAVAGPATVRLTSAPAVTVVVSDRVLFAGSVSPAVGRLAFSVTVPEVEVRTSSTTPAEAAGASGGTVQMTVPPPACGRGAQPEIAPDAPVSVVPTGTSTERVVAGAASKPLFETVTAYETVPPAGTGSKPLSLRLSTQSTSWACAMPAGARTERRNAVTRYPARVRTSAKVRPVVMMRFKKSTAP